MDAVTLARHLLGAVLVRETPAGRTAGMIVETEAYAGRNDAACHSYGRAAPTGSGKNHRTDVMFAPGGRAYVYLIYGMYHCFNVTANGEGEPEAVLIRALEPLEGLDLMAARRGTGDLKNLKKLCSGPGKLCIAMDITREDDGADLTGKNIFLQRGAEFADESVAVTPRINVDYAGDDSLRPYRFLVRDSPFLSTKKFLTLTRTSAA